MVSWREIWWVIFIPLKSFVALITNQITRFTVSIIVIVIAFHITLKIIKSKKNLEITTKHLEYFSSKEFTEYYKIARNRGTRSLNIDNNSVLFFGLKKDISLNKWEMQ